MVYNIVISLEKKYLRLTNLMDILVHTLFTLVFNEHNKSIMNMYVNKNKATTWTLTFNPKKYAKKNKKIMSVYCFRGNI